MNMKKDMKKKKYENNMKTIWEKDGKRKEKEKMEKKR